MFLHLHGLDLTSMSRPTDPGPGRSGLPPREGGRFVPAEPSPKEKSAVLPLGLDQGDLGFLVVGCWFRHAPRS